MLSIKPCVDAVKTFLRYSRNNQVLLIFMFLSGLSMTLVFKAAVMVLVSKDAEIANKNSQLIEVTEKYEKADAGKTEWMMKYIDCRNGNTKLDTVIFYLKQAKDEKNR